MDIKEILYILIFFLFNKETIILQLDFSKILSANFLEIITTIVSSIMAAVVAYYVTNLQIKSREKEVVELNLKIFESNLKLITHDLEYIQKVIEYTLSRQINDELASRFLRERLITSTWEETRITLVTHCDSNLFKELNEIYTRISLLKLEHGYTQKIASETETLINLLLKKLSPSDAHN